MAVFAYSPELERYSYPPDSPFKTQRAGMTHRILTSMHSLSGRHRAQQAPQPADRAVVERFHTARYLDVLAAAEGGHLDVDGLYMGLGTPECPVFKGMVDYAMLACGATLTGVTLLLEHRADVVFNPSGGYHHAAPERASGFCYINDVALACLLLAEQGKRVAFLDVDVHHGDGVQNAFYERRDVMTISVHESGETLFPGTGAVTEIGAGEGEGYSVNIPLPAGTYDDAYMRVFAELVVPLLGAFDPDVIVLELGMDGLAGDPLAHWRLTNGTYADVTRSVMDLGKPVLATGGGGYHPENTARGWALAWTVMCGETGDDDLALGLGGVMLGSTDWRGGLRDRVLVPGGDQLRAVFPAVYSVIETVKKTVFPLHGL